MVSPRRTAFSNHQELELNVQRPKRAKVALSG